MTDIAALSSDIAIDVQKSSQNLAQSQAAMLLAGVAPPTTSSRSDSASFSANALAQLDNQGS